MELALIVATVPLFLDGGDDREWVPATYTDAGVRDGYHGLRLANGKWFSLQPNGTAEERDSPDGPYEWFALDPINNVVRVTPRYLQYALAVREP